MKEMQPLLKGTLNSIILKQLSLHKKMYGYQIALQVKELSAGKILLTEGAIYPALHKMETDGLIASSIETIGNRQRKYYTLTKPGKQVLKLKLAALEEFIHQMKGILNLTN